MKNSNMLSVNFFGSRYSYVLAACFLLCLLFALPASAHEKMKTTVDKVDQKAAHFPGGELAWNKYLDRVMDKSVPLKKGGPPGTYTVTVTFIVDKSGAISEINAEKDPGYGTKEEAIKVIQNGPKWVPAEKDGKKVIYKHRQSFEYVVK